MFKLYSEINDLVIMDVFNKNNRKHFRLVCSYGHEIEVRGDSLRGNRFCNICRKGCKIQEGVQVGYTTGQLKVVELLPRTPYTKPKARTLCTCGNLSDMFVGNLIRTTKSCGECLPYFQYRGAVLHITLYKRMVPVEFIVDIEDAQVVLNSNWTVHESEINSYIRKSGTGDERILLHRLLTNCPDDMLVDHINGNGLDNRRSNLRVVDNKDNSRNTKINIRNTSGKSGVTYRNDTGMWRAKIGKDGKVIDLGSFSNKEDAISAREYAEIQYNYHINHGRYSKAEIGEDL